MIYKGISIKNSPMIVKLFRTIALFFIIPLITVVFIFNYHMLRYSEREISKSIVTNLKTIKNMNDILVDSISRDLIRVSLNTALDDLKEINDYYSLKGNPDDLIKLNRVRNILTSTFNTNFRLQSLYIYLENPNYIITSGAEGIVLKNEFNDMGWVDAYNEKKDTANGTIWLNSRSVGEKSGVNVLTFVLPLKNLSLNIDGAIVVNVNEKELSNIINATTDLTGSGYVFIMDNQGAVISHIDKTLITKGIKDESYVKRIIGDNKNTGYIIENINDKKSIIAYNKTEFNNWIYVGVFSLSDLMNNMNALRVNIFIILALMIILGVIMSYFISRKLYHPLNTLVQAVKLKRGIDLRDDENEMALLSRAFNTISKQENDLLDILEKNRVKLKERYLTNLLNGDMDSLNSESQNDIEFPFKYFMCCVLSIDMYRDFKANYPKEQQRYMKMLIMKLCEEAISTFYKCESVLYDSNKIVIIVNFDMDEKEKLFKTLDKSYKKVQEELSKVFENTVTISMGGCRDSKEEINLSFSEALEAHKQKLRYGYGKIIYWDNVVVKENEYFYPSNFEKHIMNHLSLGKKNETQAAVKELILEMKTRPYISCDNLMQIFIQLAGNTVKYLMDNNINISDVFGHDYNIYQNLSSMETLEEIEACLSNFYSQIIEYTRTSDKEVKDHADNVFEFIKANLKNNIDVTAIADYAGISYSYVRKIVKDRSGKTVVDYINNLRIEEAKRLLKQTNMGMADIALQVGYNNYQSFNRFFQKYEGITPGEFRNFE